MTRYFRLTLGALLLSAAAGHTVASPAPFHFDVARTSYGVVHVRADNFGGLGYGFAQAYAQDNLCMFLPTAY